MEGDVTKGYEVGKTYKVVAEYFATPDDRLNHVFTPTKLDSSGDAWVDCFCYSKDRFSTGSVVEWDVDNNRPMSETIKLNQGNKMSNTNIKQMQDQLEQAQKHLAELQKQLEDAKKKEQNVFGIGKNDEGVGFYVDQDHSDGFDSNWTNNRLLNEQYTFSTQRQAERFAEAAVQRVGEQRVIDAIKTLTGLPE